MPLARSACRGTRTGKLPRSVTLLLLCCAAQCEGGVPQRPTAESPAFTPSDRSTAPAATPDPSPAKPPASTPSPAPAESPSKAPNANQASSPALPPAPTTSAAPGPAPAGIPIIAPSPAPVPLPQKCPEGCQAGVGIALGLAIAIGIAICLYWVCWRRAAKACKSRTSAHLPTHHSNTTDMWRKHPQETALTPLHRPPKFKCGDTVLFRDDSAVIRVGDIQEYSMGGDICMVHTQRDNQIHEVAKSEIAPWFEGETGSSGRHRVLFNNGEEESEAEVVKVISRTWPPQYLLSFPRQPTRDMHQTSKEYLWPLHNPAYNGARQLL